jgi:hypothetical protein
VIGALGAAGSDCERLHDGFIAQPVNTVSSLAFVAVGVWILARSARGNVPRRGAGVALGLALVGVGVGSVAFHGPGSGTGRFVHDFSIVALLLVIVGTDLDGLGHSWRPAVGAAAVAAVILIVAPDRSSVVAAVAGVGAAGAEIAAFRLGHLRTTRPDRVAYAVAAGCLAIAITVQLLGRTDAPLCDPEALGQGHALWHVLTALTLGAWSLPALRRATKARAL